MATSAYRPDPDTPPPDIPTEHYEIAPQIPERETDETLEPLPERSVVPVHHAVRRRPAAAPSSLQDLKQEAQDRKPVNVPKGYTLLPGAPGAKKPTGLPKGYMLIRPPAAPGGEQEPTSFLGRAWQWANKPLISGFSEEQIEKGIAALTGSDPAKLKEEHPWLLAGAEGVNEFAAGFTSPLQLGLMAALGPAGAAAGKAIGLSETAMRVMPVALSGYFTLQAAKGIYPNTAAAYNAYRRGENFDAAKHATEALLDLGMAGLASTHAIRGGYGLAKEHLAKRLAGAAPEETPATETGKAIEDRAALHPATVRQVRNDLRELNVPEENHQALIDHIEKQGMDAFAKGDMKEALKAAHHQLLVERALREPKAMPGAGYAGGEAYDEWERSRTPQQLENLRNLHENSGARQLLGRAYVDQTEMGGRPVWQVKHGRGVAVTVADEALARQAAQELNHAREWHERNVVNAPAAEEAAAAAPVAAAPEEPITPPAQPAPVTAPEDAGRDAVQLAFGYAPETAEGAAAAQAKPGRTRKLGYVGSIAQERGLGKRPSPVGMNIRNMAADITNAMSKEQMLDELKVTKFIGDPRENLPPTELARLLAIQRMRPEAVAAGAAKKTTAPAIVPETEEAGTTAPIAEESAKPPAPVEKKKPPAVAAPAPAPEAQSKNPVLQKFGMTMEELERELGEARAKAEQTPTNRLKDDVRYWEQQLKFAKEWEDEQKIVARKPKRMAREAPVAAGRRNIVAREELPDAQEHYGRLDEAADAVERAIADYDAAERGRASPERLNALMDRRRQAVRAFQALDDRDPHVGEVRIDAQGHPRIYFSRAAMDMLNRVSPAKGEGLLAGADLRRDEAEWFRRRLHEGVRSDHDREIVNQVHDLLTAAMRHAGDEGITVAGRTGLGLRHAIRTLSEELIHRWQRRRSADNLHTTHLAKEHFRSLFKALPKAAFQHLRESGYEASGKGGKELFVIESAAKIMANKWRSMGLTSSEAAAWLAKYYDAVIEHHGPEAVTEVKHTYGMAREMQKEVEAMHARGEYGESEAARKARADAGRTVPELPGRGRAAAARDAGADAGGGGGRGAGGRRAIERSPQRMARERHAIADEEGGEDWLAAGVQRYAEQQGIGKFAAAPTVTPDYRAMQIADAYEAMKHEPDDPAVKAAYTALTNDVNRQWDHATKSADAGGMGITFEPWDQPGQPYANSADMRKDVLDNKHLYFFRGGDMPADHPMAQVDPQTGLTINEKLRAVHDLYGHAVRGNQFGAKGEENAWVDHSQIFSREALPALTTETKGQNSWVNFGPQMRDAQGKLLQKGDPGWLHPAERRYADNKAGLLPQEYHYRTDAPTVYVSPNVYDLPGITEAQKRFRSRIHTKFVDEAHELANSLGLRAVVESSLGSWQGGAENSIAVHFPVGTDPELVRYYEAQLGKLGYQYATGSFTPDAAGTDHAYLFHVEGTPADAHKVAATLLSNGIENSTITPVEGGHRVTVIGSGDELHANIDRATSELGVSSVEQHTGRAAFPGNYTDRDAAERDFGSAIEEIEQRRPSLRQIREGYESRPAYDLLHSLIRESDRLAKAGERPFVDVAHGSRTANIVEVSPEYWGKGPQRGAEAERARRFPELFQKRSYFRIEGAHGEPYYERLPHQYQARFNRENLYDWRADPLKLMDQVPEAEAGRGAKFTYFEKLIKDHGYDGFYDSERGEVQAFHDTPVEKKLKAGEMTLPAAQEREPSRFARGRQDARALERLSRLDPRSSLGLPNSAALIGGDGRVLMGEWHENLAKELGYHDEDWHQPFFEDGGIRVRAHRGEMNIEFDRDDPETTERVRNVVRNLRGNKFVVDFDGGSQHQRGTKEAILHYLDDLEAGRSRPAAAYGTSQYFRERLPDRFARGGGPVPLGDLQAEAAARRPEGAAPAAFEEREPERFARSAPAGETSPERLKDELEGFNANADLGEGNAAALISGTGRVSIGALHDHIKGDVGYGKYRGLRWQEPFLNDGGVRVRARRGEINVEFGRNDPETYERVRNVVRALPGNDFIVEYSPYSAPGRQYPGQKFWSGDRESSLAKLDQWEGRASRAAAPGSMAAWREQEERMPTRWARERPITYKHLEPDVQPDEVVVNTRNNLTWDDIQRHLLPDERKHYEDDPGLQRRIVSTVNMMPNQEEWHAAVQAGQIGRLWYERSSRAFDALIATMPETFKPRDKEKFLNFVAALSPVQTVRLNLMMAVNLWDRWNRAGRPMDVEWRDKKNFNGVTNPTAKLYRLMKGGERETVEAKGGGLLFPEMAGGEKKVKTKGVDLESRLNNAIRALQGQPMSGPKVSAFAPNLGENVEKSTNDTWMAVFADVDPGVINQKHIYDAVSAMVRMAGERNGIPARQAQAAIWSFIKTLAEMSGWGKNRWIPPQEVINNNWLTPDLVALHSQDFADLLQNDPGIRAKIKDIGGDLNALDRKLKRRVPARPAADEGAASGLAEHLSGPASRLEAARSDAAIRKHLARKSDRGTLFTMDEHGEILDALLNPVRNERLDALRAEFEEREPTRRALERTLGDRNEPPEERDRAIRQLRRLRHIHQGATSLEALKAEAEERRPKRMSREGPEGEQPERSAFTALLEHNRKHAAGFAERPIEEQVKVNMTDLAGQFTSLVANFASLLKYGIELPEANSPVSRDAIATFKNNPDLAKIVANADEEGRAAMQALWNKSASKLQGEKDARDLIAGSN